MSAGRLFATLAVIAAGMLAAGLLISRAAGRCTTTGYSAAQHRASSSPAPRQRQLTRCGTADTAPRAGDAPTPGASPRAPGTPPHAAP